jgi:hypothetical protein
VSRLSNKTASAFAAMAEADPMSEGELRELGFVVCESCDRGGCYDCNFRGVTKAEGK